MSSDPQHASRGTEYDLTVVVRSNRRAGAIVCEIWHRDFSASERSRLGKRAVCFDDLYADIIGILIDEAQLNAAGNVHSGDPKEYSLSNVLAKLHASRGATAAKSRGTRRSLVSFRLC